MEVGLRKRLSMLALLFGAALLSGCAAPKSGLLAQWNPFHKDDAYDERQYGPTIDDRQAEIRQVAEQAESLRPEERDQVAQQFGARLQHETSPSMKLELIRALGKLQTPMSDAALRMALADPDAGIRRTAVEAWGTRRTEQAIEVLSQTLASDSDLDVRMAAARALGNYSDRGAVESLGVALDDPNPALQYRAIESLRTATGKDYGGDVAAWRQVVKGVEPTNFEHPSFVQRWLNWY
jgi:HEAT repeat protein